MTFGAQDEDAYYARRDELGEAFAHWLNEHDVPGDPNDAGLLMDWKWSYADGHLGRWSVGQVNEFLLEWCPRKVAVPAEVAEEIPISVAAFVEFLADTGLLAPGSDEPAIVREHCERNAERFVREMADPAGGVLDADMPEISPVRIPPEEERLAAVREIPVMRRLRALAEYCAPPGRKLTPKGNLLLADARHLVDALETGDDPERGEFGKLRSSEDLPRLSRLVDTALEAGAVRRNKGRLVAVARFAALDDCAAYEKVALTAVAVGRSRSSFFGAFPEFDALAEAWTIALLAETLRHGRDGIEAEHVDELADGFVEAVAPGMSEFMTAAVTRLAHEQLDDLLDLQVLARRDAQPEGSHIALTAAGVPVAVELLRQAGFDVPIRPEPAGADAAAIVDLFPQLGDEELRRDVEEWLAARPDRRAAAAELAAESLAAHRDPVTAMTGIALVAQFAGDHAVDVLRPHLKGPHDGLVLQWLIDADALDPESVHPSRLAAGLVDFLALGLDAVGPEEVVTVLGHEAPDGGAALLQDIWRLDHPRLPDVLEAIGGHHPDKAVAKAARKALMKHKSRA
jgi:hypothetical protein